MRKSLIALSIVMFLGITTAPATTMDIWLFSKNKVEKKAEKKADKKGNKKSDKKADDSEAKAPKKVEDPYQKFVKSCRKQAGMFSVYTGFGKVYFEIPRSLLGRDMMISSKISKSSNSQIAMAGAMQSIRMIKFTQNEESIILREVVSDNVGVDGQDELAKSLMRNNVDPASDMFKIVCKSPRDSTYVIDVTPFMLSNSRDMGVSAGAGMTLSLVPPMCAVVGTQAFEKNVNVSCRMTYRAGNDPFEATLTRSIVLLPEVPMVGRKADPRMNYFRTEKILYDQNEDMCKQFHYIHRWNLAPKPEDLEAYKRGEMVEPAKPIVYYVDDAFPEKWKKYIKQGIEDWQIAFESIGFKNAIVAKDFPKDDPNFNPEDIRYSCFRYIAVPTANAMGPSWVDPRSGEIIQGSVYLYHNVLQLVHNWMFTQTAAANPAVRERVFDEKTMGRALRYIASHEIGHTVGLMHNMKASAAYPVDSLRSATFTAKYGTTSSIMDYARFNFVAQPGDKDVSFTPPLMGEYDKFSIKVGYTPIYEKDETATINGWFDQVRGNNMYVYGPQSFGMPLDPSAQSEDLGDDPVKSSAYGIKNIKYILSHLVEWTKDNGSDLGEMVNLYNQVLNQYKNHLGHVMTVIGGANLYIPTLNDTVVASVPISKAKQKEALNFLTNQIKEMPKWSVRNDVLSKLNPQYDKTSTMQVWILEGLMGMPARIELTNANVKGGYNTNDYMSDLYSAFWNKSGSLDAYERNLQHNYVRLLISKLGYNAPAVANNAKRLAADDFDPGRGVVTAASSIGSGAESPVSIEYKKTSLAQLNDIYTLAKSRQVSGDKATQNHYKYLVHEIAKALDK